MEFRIKQSPCFNRLHEYEGLCTKGWGVEQQLNRLCGVRFSLVGRPVVGAGLARSGSATRADPASGDPR
jgi:hypothetical protein